MPDLEYARRNLNINRKEAEISNNVHVLRYDKGVVAACENVLIFRRCLLK